ncbi:MAG: sigma-70 family RNA polymerase sigma factor [Pseudomonadota bacterium]|nr:sigma-70 family RNA polymerase sigma factor [Pseudomonadota bacterium]
MTATLAARGASKPTEMRATFDAALSAETLARARTGARDAQELIYRAFERPVYALVRRMVGCPDTAQDLMQDTFLRAFKCLGQYRGDAPFGAWLRRIAATEALMHLRRGRLTLELFAPEEAPPTALVWHDSSTVDLERALGLLPEVPRAVLWLYHVEGYTHQEIAGMAGKSVSFSKSQLARAHQKLRTLLVTEGAPAQQQEVSPCAPKTLAI